MILRRISAICLATLLTACGGRESTQPQPADAASHRRSATAPTHHAEASAAAAVHAVAGIPPLAHFVEQVGGDLVACSTLISGGQSPHTYAPTPRQVAALEDAHLYFSVGLAFEETIASRVRGGNGPRLVDLRSGLELRRLTSEEQAAHAHEEGAAHSHEEHAHGHSQEREGAPVPGNAGESEVDPHVWMDPQAAIQMSRTIAAALSEAAPQHAAAFERNLAAWVHELEQADARLAAALEPLRGREFFVFHPAYGYFGQRYGLTQVPVEVEGKAPSAQDVARLVERARVAGVKVIFYQPQFPRESVEIIAREIGGVAAPLDPLARDYLANLTHLAEELERALGERAGG